MTLGEYLKKLRQERGLSQPEMSELAGIEQSYLSKLENNKSIPSNDIFRNLLLALKLELEEFLSGLDKASIRQHYCHIPDIEHWLNQQDTSRAMSQRRYLYICSALIVIAVTLFYIGYSKQVFSEVRFQYESQGVVLEGEPKDIFYRWSRLLDMGDKDFHATKELKRVEMAQRRDAEIYLTNENLGPQFITDVVGGTRLFYLDKEEMVARPVNAWLQVLGVLLITMGIMGFILERRFFK